MPTLLNLSLFVAIVAVSSVVYAEDWPMWRHDARRAAHSETPLPAALRVQWSRSLGEPKPAFRNPRLQFDRGYEPVVLGKSLFVGSSRNDRLTAYDTESGKEKWRFYTSGPIRFAPVAWRGRVYVGSDDGYLYCLDARTGAPRWKYRAAPSSRKALGNGRLISMWPIRGGPVLHEGRIYFAAGVWSFEGVFVYALDAGSGELVWRNDRASFLYGVQPHGAQALAGVTPQGYLLVSGDELVVPCGSALPARFDLKTGDLIEFKFPAQGRYPGGWFATSSKARRRGLEPPLDPKVIFDLDINRDRHEGRVYEGTGVPGVRRTIGAGDREWSFQDKIEGVEGEVHSMLAADNKLFVVTRAGSLICLGDNAAAAQTHTIQTPILTPPDAEWASAARQVLDTTGARHGVGLVLGLESGQLAEALVAQSRLRLIVVDADAAKIGRLRRRWDTAGLYGERVVAYVGDPATMDFPPYLANLVVSEIQPAGAKAGPEFAQRVYESLRPYGGAVCWRFAGGGSPKWTAWAARAELPGLDLKAADGLAVVFRQGGLPGAVNYTGGWSSPDAFARAPLGVLWFDDTVAHFKRSPQPWFVDGVMISHSKAWRGYPDGDRPPYALEPAVYSDVYTGRVFSAEETARLSAAQPGRDLTEKQPEQYRPPTQKNAWKPDQPSPGKRINPLTGIEEPRVFPKSYGCDGGVDYGLLYTMRSGTAAYYDKRLESGTIHIAGPRSGCTNSVIPANGLLNVPYFYEGCVCSYPLPVGLALAPMPESYEQWTVWGQGTSEASRAPIRRVGVNFGAPGDRMTNSGTLWLDYPSIGGPSPPLDLTLEGKPLDYFYQHSLWLQGGDAHPWIAASGVRGLTALTLKGLRPGAYTVRLTFADPDYGQAERRTFDVSIQGQKAWRDLDIAREAGGKLRSLAKELKDVEVDGTLRITFDAQQSAALLCGLEVLPQ